METKQNQPQEQKKNLKRTVEVMYNQPQTISSCKMPCDMNNSGIKREQTPLKIRVQKHRGSGSFQFQNAANSKGDWQLSQKKNIPKVSGKTIP